MVERWEYIGPSPIGFFDGSANQISRESGVEGILHISYQHEGISKCQLIKLIIQHKETNVEIDDSSSREMDRANTHLR